MWSESALTFTDDWVSESVVRATAKTCSIFEEDAPKMTINKTVKNPINSKTEEILFLNSLEKLFIMYCLRIPH